MTIVFYEFEIYIFVNKFIFKEGTLSSNLYFFFSILEKLVLTDKEGEGMLVMNKEGLRAQGVGGALRGWDQESNGSRTMVPSMRMRMRHVAKTELKSGEWLDEAHNNHVQRWDRGGRDVAGDVNLALEAFEDDGVCGEAVQALVETRSYHLEMNSF
ncbi:F-box protein AUF2-like [Quercus suber]|uniref:F-box protein AUF2-like n=1 Tax=Quercus suber TaxID=58331 RepID=UPI0032DFB7B0